MPDLPPRRPRRPGDARPSRGSSQTGSRQRRKKKSAGKTSWLPVLVIGGSILSVLLCAGGGYVLYTAFKQARTAAQQELAREIVETNESWALEPDVAGQLSGATTVPQGTLQLPVGYTEFQSINEATEKVYSWKSPDHPDGTFSVVSVAEIMDASSHLTDGGLLAVTREFHQGMEQGSGMHLMPLPTQSGSIGGTHCLRTEMTGHIQLSTLYLVTYTLAAKDSVILLTMMCHEPPGSEEYRVMESSLRSYRLR